MLSLKGKQWEQFHSLVTSHIENYVIKQYGDWPESATWNYTVEDCKRMMERYVDRMGSGARGQEEALRDMVKVAHYACIAYYKINGTQEELLKENM